MNTLHQKKGNDFRKYDILADGLQVETSIEGEYQTYKMRFEEIGFEDVVYSRKPSPITILLFISLLLNAVGLLVLLVRWLSKLGLEGGLISGITAALTVIILGLFNRLFQQQTEKVIEGTRSITFFYGNKEVQEVNDFITELKVKQKAYIRKKYMRIDHLLPVDQQEDTFYWLYEGDFISRTELEILMEELDNRRIME